MISVKDSIDTLRGQFHRYRYRRDEQDYGVIAAEMGLAKATLYKFAKGGATQEDSLERIERWCAQEAERQANGDVLPPTGAPGVTPQP